MKKVTKTIAGALALVTAITAFAGCASDTQGTQSGAQSSDATSATQQTLAQDSGVQNAVSNASVNQSYKDIQVDTKIKWMAWWEIQEASPAVEMFKTLYGTPANKPEGYEDTPDENVFCNIKVTTFAERYVQLAQRIQSDDSPDCFPFEICNYPYSVAYQNLFQSVDGILDFTTDDWADYKDVIDMFNWGGKNYCPIMDLSPADLLWYRKSVVEEAGFDDPWELFEKGEWTWTTFMDMCEKFTDVENEKYAMDGYFFQNNFLATTGVPLVSLTDGKLVSNLNNGSIEKAMDILIKFDDTKESLRYPREIVNNWNPSMNEWVNGNILFYDDGTWRYEEHWYKFKKKQGWDDEEICFVPYPQMDGSDKYYQAMKQDSIMLCAGAKNIEGYKAWIYANLISTKDPDIKAAGRQQSMDNYDWTETLLDRLDILKDPDTFTAVFDFKDGIGIDIADTSNGDMPVQQLTFYPYMNGETYTSIRAANQGQIENRLEELNGRIG